MKALGVVLSLVALAAGRATLSAQRLSESEWAQIVRIFAIEDARVGTPAELGYLIQAARSQDTIGTVGVTVPEHRLLAIRALGRLGRRDIIEPLLPLLDDSDIRIRNEAATALTFALRAIVDPDNPFDPLRQKVIDTLLPRGDLGHLPYVVVEQMREADRILARALDPPRPPPSSAPARSAEALARLNRRLGTLSDENIMLLRRWATTRITEDAVLPRNAFSALISAGSVDQALIENELGNSRDQEVRRLAVALLSRQDAEMDPEFRTQSLRAALADPSDMVRYEALRAWERRETEAHGCGALVDALSDSSPHVVLAAIDAVATGCPTDDAITDRLAAEVRTPPLVEWHREAHAFITLAARSPERAALSMTSFVGHQVPEVRRYAARAAGLMKDQDTLRRLAFDADDNVRTAAISELVKLPAENLQPVFVAALGRSDYQLLRTVSEAIKGAKPDKEYGGALAEALRRVSGERKETSRDVRLTLIDRMETHAAPIQTAVLESLVRDFDPPVALAAGRAYERITGKPLKVEPQVMPRPAPPTPPELIENVIGRVTLDSGKVFDLRFFTRATPLTYARFVRLVRARYYDGLAFHRVIPNRMVQGGSPGANDEVGDAFFMRDELTTMRHERGAVGLMTRKRDHGAGQFFIDLVDNPAFDLEYTIFARVCDDGMDVVDRILEGTKMTRVELVPPTRTCRSDR